MFKQLQKKRFLSGYLTIVSAPKYFTPTRATLASYVIFQVWRVKGQIVFKENVLGILRSLIFCVLFHIVLIAYK